MGSQQKSRSVSCVEVETLFVVLILTLQVVETKAWGWFGKTGDKHSGVDTQAKHGMSALEVLSTDFDSDSAQILGSTTRGKELYEQSTSLMAGHTCWQKAYKGMATSCRDILSDETKKTRLALKLTDCFLMTSGRPGLNNCPNNAPIVSCVRSLDDHNHAIFLAWFVDVAAMCHYMQSEEFKLETEKAVKLLKDSTHKTQDKLDTMNIHLDVQHSQLMQHTEYIQEAQEILQKGHEALQASIEEGMGRIQETSQHVRSGLEDVHDLQKEVAHQNEKLAEVMVDELSELQLKSNVLANSLGSLYGTVESLAEQSKVGQEQARQSLTNLKDLHKEAKEQSKNDLKRLSHEALKVYDAYKTWQTQLGGTHQHLVETATEITRNHDTILTKQSQVNKLIMEVLEALMALQKGWIFESRMLRSVGIYLGASILVYLSTATKKTQSARLALYLGLFSTLISEIYIVHYGIEVDSPSKEGQLWPPNKVSWLRYTFIALGSAFLLYSFLTYKDYKVLNHRMLAENADLMNNLANDLNVMLKEVKNLASRQANVEEALGISNEVQALEEGRPKRRTRFTTPHKPPLVGSSKVTPKDKRAQSSPY